MRFPIRFSRFWRPLLRVFGFSPDRAAVELDGGVLRVCYGTVDEVVPLDAIAGASLRRWPAYYGVGAKLGPDRGVSYVASTDGVVRIDFTAPRPMPVWGPFRASAAECVLVSLDDPQGFIAALAAARRTNPP